MRIKLTVDGVESILTHIDYEYFWAVDPDRLKIKELSSNSKKKTKMRSDNWFKDPTKIVEIIKPDLYDTNLRPSQAPKIRPTKYILGGLFNIELDATYGNNDDFFFDWFIKGRVIDGYFEVFHNKNEAPIKIEFWDCFIADYEEYMTQGSQAHKIKLRLSPAITRNRKYVLHEKVWKTTDIHQEVKMATSPAEAKPTHISSYFEDENQNRIKHIKPNKTVYFIFKTQNCIGEIATIDLSDDNVDYEYEGRYLENDLLEEVKITANTMKIKFQTLKQI